MVIALPILAAVLLAMFYRGIFNIKNPDLISIVFIRDYIGFTSIGYIYYKYAPDLSYHYILGNIKYLSSIDIAALAAFYFICVFAIFYSFFKLLTGYIISRIYWRFPYKGYVGILSVFTLVSGGALIFFMITYKASVVALLSGLSPQEVNEVRATLSQSGGFLQFLKLLATTWVPMASFVWFYLWCLDRGKLSRFQKFLVFFSIACGCLAAMWSLEKSRLAFYLFGFVGVWLYAGKEIRTRSWAVIVVSSIVIVAIAYILTYGDRITDLNYLTAIIEHRVMLQSAGSIAAFDLYPDVLPFKGISGISNYLAGLAGETFSSPYSDIVDYMVPESADTSGAMSSFATGEAYALFGMLGLMVAPVIAALYFGAVAATKHAGDARIFWVPLYAMFFSMPYLATSFYSFFWPVGFLISMAPFVAMALLAELLRLAAK